MGNNNHEDRYDVNNLSGFLAGLLLGGLAGAGAMLLLAPQSGRKTRAQIQQKGMELRDQTAETVADSVAQVRTKAQKITTSIHEQAEELQQRGQEVVDQQRERWAPVVEAGKTAVQDA